ncbi:MAG: hypothetical protein J5685_07245 [Clostridiales bacterium]|nr:hypothetical protein [Clostridiales bacterium]
MEETKVIFDLNSQKSFVLKRCGILVAVFAALFVMYLGMAMVPFLWDARSLHYILYFIILLLTGSLFYTVFMIRGFKRQIKTFEYTPEGIRVNDDLFISDLDHGVGVNFKMVVPGKVDLGGVNMTVSGIGDNGKRIEKTYWAGPLKNQYCLAKRTEIHTLIQKRSAIRREGELLKISEENAVMTARYDMSGEKKKRYLKFTAGMICAVLLAAVALILLYGSLSGDYMTTTIGCFAAILALTVTGYSVNGLLRFKSNLKRAAEKIIFSKESLNVNGKDYAVTGDLSVYIRLIGVPDETMPGTYIVLKERATQKNEEGYYLRIRDKGNEDLYWLGMKIDGSISMTVSICSYIIALKAKAEASASV